jgi:hypothetical protein
MIEHKLSNKTKSATVDEPKLFRQLNNPIIPVMEVGPAKFSAHHQVAVCNCRAYYIVPLSHTRTTDVVLVILI